MSIATTQTIEAPLHPANGELRIVESLIPVERWAEMTLDIKPHYELIDGKLVQKMTTQAQHAKAAGRFYAQCDAWGSNLGWEFLPEGTGVRIDPFNGTVPDVVGFAPESKINPRAARPDQTPFLVAEVLSPSSIKRDRIEKTRDYARAGIQIYVLIDPEARTVEVYRLENGGYGEPQRLNGDDVWQPDEFPGLRLELSRLWFA